MKNDKSSEYLFIGLLIIPVIWFGILIAPYIDAGLISVLPKLTYVINHPFDIKLCSNTLRSVFIVVIFYLFGVAVYVSSIKNTRRNEEYGSAKWGNVKQVNKKYANPDYFQNKLFSNNVRMGLDVKRFQRNLNTIIIGGSGAGKTRYYAKPNIMQCNTSYVILDPKGGAKRSYLKRVGTALH